MKYLAINKQIHRTINIPKLSGGLNFRDSLTGVRDNQLTDSVNMWCKNGMLRTRPPFISSNATVNTLQETSIDVDKVSTRFHSEVKLKYNKSDCVCASSIYFYNDDEGNQKQKIDFEFQAADKIFVMPSIKDLTTDDITYFLTKQKDTLYCYISDFTIWKLEYTKDVDEDGKTITPEWEKINLAESYIPLVMTHCKSKETKGTFECTGTQFEGFNILTNSFKMIYSTVNREALTSSVTTVNAEYPLVRISSLENLNGATFIAKYTRKSGKIVTHTIECPADNEKNILYENVSSMPADQWYMYVTMNGNKVSVGFSAEKSSSTPYPLEEKHFQEDNLEIIVIIPNTENLALKKIFNMQNAIWFGGSSSGIYSGSRLFLGANTNDDEKSLVFWSSLNNPLYFPENCYAYVGDNANAVTAFGRQDDKLIIFKESEMYYTYYVYNESITADSMINQTVVDYEASAVSFPMTLLNGFIGCDCPGSIQMCRNRLVWASSIGKVYTLCKINQYDEHTVYEISEMIAPRLKKYNEQLKASSSADFAGHYILFLGDNAFVADYNSYGYQYIYSYSKTDDSNVLLPWYYWDFSFLKTNNIKDEYKCACVCALNNTLLMRTFFDSSDERKRGFVGFEMSSDSILSGDTVLANDYSGKFLKSENTLIDCSLTTKLFEFGEGIYNLNVDNVTIKTGSNDGADIKVKFISELGENTAVITEKRKYNQITDKNFIKPKRLYPCMRAIRKMGIELSCSGILAIDGLTIQYRLLGGVK